MEEQLPKEFFKFVICFLKEYKWWVYALVGCAALSGSYGTINSYLTKILIDGVANSHYTEQDLLNVVLLPSILIIISYEMHGLCSRAMNYIRIKIAPNIRNQITEKLFSYTQYHSFNFFQDNFSGSISNNINKIAENIEIILHHNCLFIFRGFTQLIFTLVIMHFVNPIFSITLLLWTIFFFVITLKFSNKIKTLSDSYAKANSDLSGKIIDSISNLNNVRLFSREIFEVEFLRKYLKTVADKFRAKEWFLLKLWWIQGFSITILIAIMIFTLIKLKSNNMVTVGDFALILGLVLYVTENVWHLTELIDKLYDAIGQCNQGLNMIVIPHEIKDISDAKPLVINKGEIRFHEVNFNYKDNENIFNDISITIPGGQKVGLVGFSGCGKTTFIHLITRLFNLSSGAITIDDQDIVSITQRSLRENIGFIPQDPTLFHRSIIENIRYGKMNVSDEEIISSAKKAQAHDFISSTPEGYYSLVGEKGMKLSGGQRQRLSIARTILKNAPILILDEATSALDSVTEIYIQESLNKLMHEKTVIVIAHRLSTLLSLDRILVFDQGRIVEDGTHLELLARKGIYALLWHSQVGGFLPETMDINTKNTQVLNKFEVSFSSTDEQVTI